MRIRAVGMLAVLVGGMVWSGAATPAPPTGAPGAVGSTEGLITSGWVVLKEGEGEGTMEMDAKHATNPSPHLLKLSVTKYPEPGKGRFGAKNTAAVPVKEGGWYDVTFNGISEGIGVGLVFSLETSDGKVLARTTLPEIGRGGGRGGRGRGGAASASAPAAAGAAGGAGGVTWRPYLVSLHARGSGEGHLVVTPIETVPVWMDQVRLVERKVAP